VDDELEGGTKGLFGTVEFNNTEVSVALALSALEQRIPFYLSNCNPVVRVKSNLSIGP